MKPRLEQLEDRCVPTAVSLGHAIALPGHNVQVPILVDRLADITTYNSTTDPFGAIGAQTGIGNAVFVINYDPKVLAAPSAGLGTLRLPDGTPDQHYNSTYGWQYGEIELRPGSIEILAAPGSRPITTADSGTLAVLTFHVQPTAPTGVTHLDLAADAGTAGWAPTTYVEDGQDNMGSPGFNYKLNCTDNTGDVQTLALGGAGTFALAFDGVTSGPVTYSDNVKVLASNIQKALNEMGVTAVASATTGGVRVTFGGLMTGQLSSAIGLLQVLPDAGVTGSVTDNGLGYFGGDPMDGRVMVHHRRVNFR